MKTNTKSWNLDTVVRRKNKINPKPPYQRGAVWSEGKKQLLIDTILRGYDIPKIYLRESCEGDFEHEVVDGQQRLRAIWEFVNNEFTLGQESKDLPHGDLIGVSYKDLDSDIQDKLGLYDLTIVFIEDSSDLEIRDLFLRLQEGVSLNPAEKRNAMPGNMRDFISELSSHTVFNFVNVTNKRFLYDDWLAHVVCIEINDGPIDIKANNLKKLYEDNRDFASESKVGKKVKKVLSFMAKALSDSPPEMRIKWGFVDLYILVSGLIDDYVLNGKEVEFGQFFVGFERERSDVDDPADLISDGSDYWDRDLYNYIQAFQTSGALRKNIQERADVYLVRAFRDIDGLEPKDSTRLFNENQKIVIWRRDGGKCRHCGCDVEFREMHADHIIPHSKGGKTIVENGQTLCVTCNLKKGSH